MATTATLIHSLSTITCTMSLPPSGLANNSMHSLKRNNSLIYTSSSSSISNISGIDSLFNLHSPKIGFGSIYKKLWHGLLFLCYDPYPEVAKLAQTVINYIVTQALDFTAATKLNSSTSLSSSPNIRVNLFGESSPAQNLYSSNPMNSNDNPQRLTSAVNDAGSKFIVMPQNRNVGGVFEKRSNNALYTPSEDASISQNNSKHNLQATAGSGETDEVVASSKPPKPIVSTNFIPWCVSHFSTPIWKQEPDRPDRYAPDQLDRIQRNTNARRIARGKPN